MAFNSQTYHRNRCKRKAKAELATARDIKRRAALGKAYDWEIERIPTLVQIARINWHLYLSMLRVQRIK